MDSSQYNIALIERFFDDAGNRDDLSQYHEYLSPNVVIHGPASGQKTEGIQEARALDKSYIRAYPQKKFIIEKIDALDDRVYVRWICHGQHKKPYKGLRVKNFDFAISGLSMYRIIEGKIIEIWQHFDRLGLLEQIGEVSARTKTVEPGYYLELLKSHGMEKYLDSAPLLTPRERECLHSLLEGKTAKETAVDLELSPRTVESYFDNIKKKLNCPSKRDLFTAAHILNELDLL